MDNKKKLAKKNKKKIVFNGVKGLNIDKNEYQEIVLSNTNIPDKIFKK